MPQRLLTNVSSAFWCNNAGTFEPATVPVARRWPRHGQPESISWLDILLDGGLVIPTPTTPSRALTLLITGPPGCGKSTLALELCYRWTDGVMVTEDDRGHFERMDRESLASLYITSEASEEWAIEKARLLGWKWQRTIAGDTGARNVIPMTTIWSTTEFADYVHHDTDEVDIATGLVAFVTGLFQRPADPGPAFKLLAEKWKRRQIATGLDRRGPDVLVIDSLNTLELSRQPALYRRFHTLINAGPRIIITVLESDAGNRSAEFWEYLSDVVIRLDRRTQRDYMVRTIEVVKARYQSHVWGSHQLKIYPPRRGHATDTNADARTRENRRAHPYRNEGGIFVFPSIHYFLSIYKRQHSPVEPGPFQTPLPALNEILNGGFPTGRCTGFVGTRGGHKSHLGYLSVLSQLTRPGSNSRALIISLRDDEGMAHKTMNNILRRELQLPPELTVQHLEQRDQLELLYYPPGYITPEEFFHRMYVSVQRLKASGAEQLTVVFNSLDQLSSRFPLCAREQIFIPGIIQMLSAENVTSFFIAVDEPGQPEEQYGLLSMADALLSFRVESVPVADYIGHIAVYTGAKVNAGTVHGVLPAKVQTVVTRVVRFAGGQAAGAGGLLELVHAGTAKHRLYGKEGLNFVPFSPRYAESVAPTEESSAG